MHGSDKNMILNFQMPFKLSANKMSKKIILNFWPISKNKNIKMLIYQLKKQYAFDYIDIDRICSSK